MGILSYRDLVAWQRAMELVQAIYRATREFPQEEIYGLTSQVRRAAVSVNIAEGRGRHSTNEFVHHLAIARGSLCEVETHILIAHQLRYLPEPTVAEVLALTDEVSRLITGLTRSLKHQ
jgi:four helix bundle protein